MTDDPLLSAKRDRQNGEGAQTGFNIGTSVVSGDTIWGPGKQQIRDVLPSEEVAGFDAAVVIVMQRNNNLDRARLGARIAEDDPEVAAERVANPDPRYWLGFDIATAI